MDLEERIKQLEKQKEILKARIKELDNSLSIALEVNDKHQRYNGQLQSRLTEVEEGNKKLPHQIEDKLNQLRKSGM